MDAHTALIPLKDDTLLTLLQERHGDETLDATIRRLANPRTNTIPTDSLSALGTRVFSSPLLKRRAVHDLLEALLEFPTYKAPRMRIITRVKELRRQRGEYIADRLEESVQRSFQNFCGDADGFNKGAKLNLFCWPEGKGRGIWGLNAEAVESYLLRLEKKVRVPSLSDF